VEGKRREEEGKTSDRIVHAAPRWLPRTFSFFLFPFSFGLAGCALNRSHLDRALMAGAGAPVRNEGVAEDYTVACPDVIELMAGARAEFNGPRAVGPDGSVDLGSLGRLRVEGARLSEVARRVAIRAGVSPNQVHVRVAEHNSQQIYLIGEVTGFQRAVAYCGPETVLDVLQRTGGLTPGAEPEPVYVIRSRVADGRPPEVVHVDLPAILMKKDERSNIRLQPFDQVFVGETRQSIVDRCIPPFMRPVYQTISGFRRPSARGIEELRN